MTNLPSLRCCRGAVTGGVAVILEVIRIPSVLQNTFAVNLGRVERQEDGVRATERPQRESLAAAGAHGCRRTQHFSTDKLVRVCELLLRNV